MDSKICATCGRTIEYRKKWEKNWADIKYCSDQCRKQKSKSNYKDQILALLEARGAGKTICPSELLSEVDKQDSAMMEKVRQSARLLVAEGKIQITQNNHVVDPSTAKGPIRLRLVRR